MQSFHPHTIHHIQLAALNEFAPPSGDSYIVFWWKKIPLGHLWLDSGETVDVFKTHAAATIAPTIEYYLKQRKIDDEKWRAYLSGENFTGLDNFLEHSQINQ